MKTLDKMSKDHDIFTNYYYNQQDKPKNIMVDMDEVLTDIAPRWVDFIFANKGVFKDFFDLTEKPSLEDIHNREIYYLDKWLLKDDRSSLTKEEFALFMSIYTRDDFYQGCTPTNFAEALKLYAKQDICNEIYVVSDTISGTEDSKKDWLVNFFEGSEKVFYVPVMGGKKSRTINGLGLQYDSFTDDRIENIIDVALNCNGLGKEFLIPTKGYNEPNDDLINLKNDLVVNISYFKNI